MTKVPFILDTDTAQDDCVAILFGLLDERADLRAITMVAGNVGFERQIKNAQMTLNGLIVKMSVFWFGIRRCPAVLW